VSKREKESNSVWIKLVSVFLMVLSLAGLLGALGFSIGKPFYFLFTAVLGNLAWAGLLLGFVLAILLWIYSSNLTSLASTRSGEPSTGASSRLPRDRRKMQSDPQNSEQVQSSIFKQSVDIEGIPLPAGKLVSLQGFNKYFSSPEWVEMKDANSQKAEEMKEMGSDFSSYFGVGESFVPKRQAKIKNLKGLNDYIKDVDHEESLERAIPWQDSMAPTENRKNVVTQDPLQFSSVFKSKTDQEEFLAQFKVDENPLDLDTFDFGETLSEDDSMNAESEGIALGVEYSVVQDEVAAVHSTIVSDLKDDSFQNVSTSLEMLELEAPVAAAVEWEPIYAGQVAELVNQRQGQPKVAEKPQVLSIVKSSKNWECPDFNLLDPVIKHVIFQDTETSMQLEKVLLEFGVKAKVIRVTRGPVITRYELAPAPGVKISKIVNLSDDIALGLAARDVRIEAPIPGKAAVGIEVPNKVARSVPFREVLETTSFGQHSSKLKIALGKDIADQPIIADLIKMPHLLVAGATGSGKSVCITTIINSILYNATPDEVKFLLVDPKMVELNQYNGIPHLLAPVVVDPKKAASALKWIVKEMENRYGLFAAAGVKDIERYNKFKAGETMSSTPTLPLIVVIIDELADLMMVAAGEVEEAIGRLAQMARAAGIHLVIATQRPSVDVITGVIKANIPSRISFAVSSQIDSRTILDATGAEKLLGRGDMLYSPLGENKALRVQGCLVTDDEVQRVITHWKELGKPEYLDPERLFAGSTLKNEESNGADDALFLDAGQLFIRTSMASVSYLQRRLKLGYARAARLMDMLEEQGVVGAYEGNKPRQVLITLEEFNDRFG